jgi:hypothetical protein
MLLGFSLIIVAGISTLNLEYNSCHTNLTSSDPHASYYQDTVNRRAKQLIPMAVGYTELRHPFPGLGHTRLYGHLPI